MSPAVFQGSERKFLLGIAFTFSLLQLGLLLVMPFLAVFGSGLRGASPALVGLSIGAFGLTQAFLQVPYGNWSDRYGRKKMVIIGLMVYAIGLFIGFLSHTIGMLIAARAIQGAGAIGTVMFAWIGDRFEAERRNRAMAFPGIFVGITSVLSFIAGPLLHKILTVNQVFLIIFFMILGLIVFIQAALPSQIPAQHTGIHRRDVFNVLRMPVLWTYLMAGVMLNFTLTSLFFLIPTHLETLGQTDHNWIVFVPTTITGMAFLALSSRMADKGRLRTVMISGFSLLLISAAILLIFPINLVTLLIATFFFMGGYMSLNTTLPAAVTLLTGSGIRGTVTGVFSTFQHIGSFTGSTLTGILFAISPNTPVIAEIALLLAVILLLAIGKTLKSE